MMKSQKLRLSTILLGVVNEHLLFDANTEPQLGYNHIHIDMVVSKPAVHRPASFSIFGG